MDCLDTIADSVSHLGRTSSKLRQLCVLGPESGAATASSLPWLLTHAPGIRVLAANVGATPWFPPLTELTHLVLEFPSLEVGNLCSALPGATALQTVSLSFLGEDKCYWSPTLNPLILDSLPHLETLVLRNIRPRKLEISASCCLHLLDYHSLDMADRLWAGLLSNIRSIGVTLETPYVTNIDRLMSACLEPLQKLCKVTIKLEPEWRYLLTPLCMEAFSHLQRVAVTGTCMHICIPLEVSWQEASFDATEDLTLDFRSIEAFVSAVPRFSASASNFTKSRRARLCAVLDRRRISWGCQKGMSAIYKFWYPAENGPARPCGCGACLDCLVASGKAVAQA